jgi:hypothetical protein
MLPSWLSKKSNNIPQALSLPDHTSKASRSTVELTGHSSQSAIPITDDDHHDVHEHIWDPSTYSAPTEQEVLRPDSSFTSSDVKSLGHFAEPARFQTPHDDILAELQGHLPSGGPQAAEQQSLRSDAPPGSSFHLGSSAVENSLFTSESLPNHEPTKEVMYEPATGQKLSDFVPTPMRSGADDELWSQLSHILELQSEISKMHVDMENVGLRTARGHNGPAVPERGGKAGTTRNERGKNRRRSDTLGEEEDDDESDEMTEGEDSDDNDEVFGKRTREGEFTRLAERFAEKKVSIDAVMNKVHKSYCSPSISDLAICPVGQPFERTQDLSCATHSSTRSCILSYQHHVFQFPASRRSRCWCGHCGYLDNISSPSFVSTTASNDDYR